MSANNFIKVSKVKNRFVVEDRDADTGQAHSTYVFDTFKEAREKARSLERGEEDGYPAEYGIELDESCFDCEAPEIK